MQFRGFGGLALTILLSAVCAAVTAYLLGKWQHADYWLLISALLPWFYILLPADLVRPFRGLLLLVASLLLIVWPSFQPQQRFGVGLVAVGLGSSYLLTLQRTVGRADTFEFQVTAPVLGIAHPTGYPLYTLLGGLFSVLPLGQVATRVNLTSMVSATVAGILIYLLLTQVLRIKALLAALASIWIGLTPVLWSQAVVAEVYAFNALFASAILLVTLWIAERHPTALALHPDVLGPVSPRIVMLLITLCGLSLTNHLTTVFLLPGAALALIIAWPRLSLRQWLIAVGLGAGALLIYLYIPLRWPALHDGRLMPFADFIGWITGSRFSGALQLRAWYTDASRWGIVGRLLLEQAGWVGVIGGTLGLALLIWRRWQIGLLTLIAFVGYGFYGLNYLVPDIAVFLIPMYVLLGIWFAFAVSTISSLLQQRLPEQFSLLPEAVATTAFTYLLLTNAWTHGPSFDWSDEVALEGWGRYTLSQPLDPAGAILADSEKIAPLEYLHRIEGQKPDMDMVVLGLEEEYITNLFARLEAQQTVYLARLLPGLEGPFHLRSVGPLVEVGTQPLQDNPAQQPQSTRWTNGISLVGVDTSQEQEAGSDAHITLYWRVDEPIPQNYHVHLRLLAGDGRIVWQNQPGFPVSNRYPTVAWKPPEIIPDYYAIDLPQTLNSGRYQVQVALAPPFSTDYVSSEEDDLWVSITDWSIEPSEHVQRTIARRMALTLPHGAVLGVEIPQQAPANDLPDGFALQNIDGQQTILNIEAVPVSSGVAEYRLAMDDVRCGWLRPITDECVLGIVTLTEPTPDAVANFNNQIVLSGVDFASGQIQPGQAVDVTLYWQGLQSIQDDYTVFVHLLGPDGRLHGQIDSWPVQGTYPTSTWPIDDTIVDRYSVELNTDAPPGAYRLEVGMYLLATNTRLNVVNEAGQPVADKLSLAGLLVPE